MPPRLWKWLRRLVVATVVLGVLAAMVGGYGLIEARSDPLVRTATLSMKRFPAHTPPLRLALVSDIHVGNLAMPTWRLNRIVDQINALKPDVVVITGDFVNGDTPGSTKFHPGMIEQPLARLRAPLGVYGTLGNHDLDTNPQLVELALQHAHVRLLSDEVARVGPIALIGVDFGDTGRHELARGLDRAHELGGVPVLATHAPPKPWHVPLGIPLVLAGHTHCGQIVLPGWDNSWDMTHHEQRFDPQFRCGIIPTGSVTMVVTGGVGAASGVPFRIGAPSDIWLLTLKGG